MYACASVKLIDYVTLSVTDALALVKLIWYIHRTLRYIFKGAYAVKTLLTVAGYTEQVNINS